MIEGDGFSEGKFPLLQSAKITKGIIFLGITESSFFKTLAHIAEKIVTIVFYCL